MAQLQPFFAAEWIIKRVALEKSLFMIAPYLAAIRPGSGNMDAAGHVFHRVWLQRLHA